jgi:hypothetical protein
MEGLPEFLDKEDIAELVDTLLKVCLSKGAHQLKASAHRCLVELWMGLPGGSGGKDHLVVSRLQDWISHFEKQGNPDSTEVTRKIKAEIDDMNIPF